MENQFELMLLLLAIAAATTAFSKKMKLPYPITLVIAGVVIGLLPIPGLHDLKSFFAGDTIFHFAIISIFLPTLLGEAALNLPYHHLKENRVSIVTLAFFGTLISFAVTASLSGWFLFLPLQAALIFGALMAPTDPVSVLSIFRSMGVNRKLSVTMEGESLFNDGLAVVLFTISAYMINDLLDKGVAGYFMALFIFLKIAIGGVLIGAFFGYLFSKLTSLYDDYPLEIIFSMLLFYGVYFIAEALSVSGVIAVVVAGLIFGNYGKKIGMSPTTSMNIKTFWDVMSLVANSVVFLLVGLEITRISLGHRWLMILIAILIILISRSVAVYIVTAFLREIPSKWKHVFNWGGLKGSLSLALALSLPKSFPMREDLLVLAFGVVLFSLLIQGVTMKPLVRALGIKTEAGTLLDYERLLSQIHRFTRGRERLNHLKREGTVSPGVASPLTSQYDVELEKLHQNLDQLYEQHPSLKKEQTEQAAKEALIAEHAAIDHLARHDLISKKTKDEQQRLILDILEKREEND
ncbi:MAG TPA: cation:proton antiporter [Bacillales bacterium]|nr:cation:proton antiporter [Bacillales bacterium]